MSAFGKRLLKKAIATPAFSGRKISTLRDRDFVHLASAVETETFGALAVLGQPVITTLIAPGFIQHQLIDESYIIIDADVRPSRRDGWMVYASNDPV